MSEPSASDVGIPLSKLIQLYLAVVHTEASRHEPHEREAAVELCLQWAPSHDRAEVEAMVDTAYVAFRSGFGEEAEAIAKELGAMLPAELRTRIVRDLGLIARADGHLTLEEARRIGSLRAALGTPAGPRPA